MQALPIHEEIFRRGSKTYFNSSLFFPKDVRQKVFILYAYVRVADDFVDAVPQDSKGFYDFKKRTFEALEGKKQNDPVLDYFADLYHQEGFEKGWVEAFLNSMEMDLSKSDYNTLDETLEYIYGSAEVIGLFMSCLLGLDPKSYPYASNMGRSMQFINFIRDINEDNGLGRRYIPLVNTTLEQLSKEVALENPEEFKRFMKDQTKHYKGWQKEAEKGYHYIPKRYLVPIKTASDMYNWTAAQIEKDPMIVFEKKVKPSKLRIIWTMLKNLFYKAKKP